MTRHLRERFGSRWRVYVAALLVGLATFFSWGTAAQATVYRYTAVAPASAGWASGTTFNITIDTTTSNWTLTPSGPGASGSISNSNAAWTGFAGIHPSSGTVMAPATGNSGTLTLQTSGGTTVTFTAQNTNPGNLFLWQYNAATGGTIQVDGDCGSGPGCKLLFDVSNITAMCSASGSTCTLTPAADLRLTQRATVSNLYAGQTTSIVLTIQNISTNRVTGVTVSDILPAGLAYASSGGGTGTYDSGTGLWFVGAINAGATVSIKLNLNVTVPTGGTVTNVAEITTSSLPDPDSTPNDRVVQDDDYAVAQIVVTPAIDLSVIVGVSTKTPSQGQAIYFTINLMNNSPTLTATGVATRGLLPTGFTFTGASGPGSYDSSTGVWTAGSIPPASRLVLYIYGIATASDGTVVAHNVEIIASANSDPDSTPDNGRTTEDDYSSRPFTVTPVPILATPLCPAGVAATSLTTNGDFDLGTGPNWPGWSVSGAWAGSGAAIATAEAISGDLTQTGATGVDYGPSPAGSATLQFSLQWLNGFPEISSTESRVDIILGGVTYATIATGAADASLATISYANGASGNLTTITDGLWTGIKVDFPANVPPSGDLIFRYRPSPTGPGDDYSIDNIRLFTCTRARLAIVKSVSSWDQGTSPAFHTPENDVSFVVAVSNTTSGPVTTDSVFLVEAVPAGLVFFNGDANGTSAGTDAVTFTDNGSGLTWNYARDVRYATAQPSSFNSCTYTPAAGYDANVRYICINPKGTMAPKVSATTPGFSIGYRAQIP